LRFADVARLAVIQITKMNIGASRRQLSEQLDKPTVKPLPVARYE
jgi:hypothetical protein